MRSSRTLSEPEQPRIDGSAAAARALAILPALPRDAGGPVFREPWEAQAFAMALSLNERGVFTWSEWAERLGAAIKHAQGAGDPDLGDTYYRHWLAALEALLAEKGVAGAADVERYARAWEHAAARTPHGEPITLAAQDFA
jgi:nitrile hydratase accessory protein